MESLFMEETAMNLRSLGLNSNTSRNMYQGFGFRSPRFDYLHPSSLPPAPVHRQPPLLPLPIKSATLPSTNKNISTGTGTGTGTAVISRTSSAAARQSNNQKRKKKNPKPPTSLKKEPAAAASKPVKNKAAAKKEETEEESLIKPPSAYSLSPPPSSLPLPRLLLLRSRPRTAKVVPVGISCKGEARGVGVDAGATDGLRKILRL